MMRWTQSEGQGRFFDQLECRDPENRERYLFDHLPMFLAYAKNHAPGLAQHLGDAEPWQISSRQALAALPVLRKPALTGLQKSMPPFGGFTPAGAGVRIFMSPGPIFEPQPAGADPWNVARALFAAGFRKGDLVHNSFSYHMTPGGFMLDAGARALGCAVFPAGAGNTRQQVAAIAHLRPQAYAGTPDHLQILLDKAQEMGQDASSITKALVSGGALFPAKRASYTGRGVRVLQAYATADLGVIAYESEAMEGLIVNENIIVEIVRPGAGDPLPDGEAGEVVVTVFNEAYPLIRFATGDLSAVMPGRSPCGRTNVRLKGWMGRAGQTAKIKGLFVHPSQIAEIAKRHPELGRLRLVITRENGQDVMTLKAESASQDADFIAKVEESLQAAAMLEGRVELLPPGALPNDGKVIADERDYNSTPAS